MNGELEARNISIYDDGKQLNVTLELHNNSARTIYAYRDVRGMRYDPATRTLQLWLTDRHKVEGLLMFAVHRPPLVAIGAGESEKLNLRVARVMTQLGPEESGTSGPTLIETPIHEAETVELDVSWGDTPFYPEPGEKRKPAEQLRRWERGAITARFDRNRPA